MAQASACTCYVYALLEARIVIIIAELSSGLNKRHYCGANTPTSMAAVPNHRTREQLPRPDGPPPLQRVEDDDDEDDMELTEEEKKKMRPLVVSTFRGETFEIGAFDVRTVHDVLDKAGDHSHSC